MKRRPRAVLASAAITLLALAGLSVIGSPPSAAQTICIPPDAPGCTTTTTVEPTTTTVAPTTTAPVDPTWDGSKWTSPPADGATLGDGTFTGTFVHHGPPPIDHIDLAVTYSDPSAFAPACGKPPGKQPTQSASTTSTSTPSSDTGTSTVDFLFEVAFACNGIYDADATATLRDTEASQSIRLQNLRVAVPPQRPASLVATDNGNQTVTLTWQAPDDAPPDLIGYRLSRRDGTSQNYAVLAQTSPTVLTFDDTNIPSGGASYFYEIQTLRASPNGTLTSVPVETSGALAVAGAGAGSRGGGTVRGAGGPVSNPGSGGTGTQFFDSTLPEDGGPGSDQPVLPNIPGADTVQRFVDDHGGEGLLKPFGAALNLGVWAALILFITRRAAREERAALLSIEFEDAP